MARKRKYGKEYAEYRYRYQTYAAQKAKNKYAFDDPAMDMLSEDDFYMAMAQNPKLSQRELAHKSVYGLTIQEGNNRVNAARAFGLTIPSGIIKNLSHEEWAKLMAPYIDDVYGMYKDNGNSSTEAAQAIGQTFFGSE